MQIMNGKFTHFPEETTQSTTLGKSAKISYKLLFSETFPCFKIVCMCMRVFIFVLLVVLLVMLSDDDGWTRNYKYHKQCLLDAYLLLMMFNEF